MDLSDCGELGAVLAALAVVLAPMLLARWLIGRGHDGHDSPTEGPGGTPGAGAAGPRQRRWCVSRFKGRP